MTNGNNMTTFNLKLRENIRKEFKSMTHSQGTTMQAVLSAFAESFIENPEKFKIKMEIVDSGI